MHGEDYICLGFLFGENYRVAYISDVSRIPSSTEHGMGIVTFVLCTYSFFTLFIKVARQKLLEESLL